MNIHLQLGSAEDERRIKEMNEGVKVTDQKRLKEENIEKVPAKVEVTEQDSEIMEKKSVIARLDKELLQRMLDLGLEVERESSFALDLIRVFNSPCFMVKSWLVQDQTVLGKDYSNLLIADSLLKTIWFINAPCYGNEALASLKANELTIPEQTATGKGTSNPLMAGSLPKTTKLT
ncbi:hypothetical protein Tco_0623076 [Tanacetum coccineum]